jgi:epoxyqueuosine reductase
MTSRYRRSRAQRLVHRWAHQIGELGVPLARRFYHHRPVLWVVPTTPLRLAGSMRSPARPFPGLGREVPTELKAVPGIRLDSGAQAAAAAQAPLWDFFLLHKEGTKITAGMWPAMLAAGPRLYGSVHRRRRMQNVAPARLPVPDADPAMLTERVKQRAAELGISTLGVARFDPKYQFADYRGNEVGDRVIVAILEQNYESTQMCPSITSERAALSAYSDLEDRMMRLADWLRQQGYRARPDGFLGESMAIAYAVQAGLGQLGLNGQLLTPEAGSRVRIHLMSTDAPLQLDEPVDYGLEGVCDRCQICVRRCPVGAIPAQRKEKRGVVKASLNTKRCFPIMAQAAGCSICMKVCPVQRFGLRAVLDEFDRTGTILGKSTDDLEGYDWPLDGRHYGPGESPRIPVEVIAPARFVFDPAKTQPDPAERGGDR